MPKTFQRNGQFWLLALQVATVNFFTGGFGPSQALLREDQALLSVSPGFTELL